MLFYDINSVPTQYPWLSFNEDCEVLIVGGGVGGCIMAHSLATAGIDTVQISKKPIGFNSCAIDSSTLNFQNEVMLNALVASVGRETALRYFSECGEALSYIEELATEHDFDFAVRDSLAYTNNPENVNDLHTEYLMRKHNGFDVEFLEKSEARNRYSFEVLAGILSKNAGGELDCYKLCHALVKSAEHQTARAYENTSASDIISDDDGITVETDNLKKIRAKKIIFATGYKQDEYLNMLTGKRRSYFLATTPVSSFSGLENRELVRNIDRNVNLRTTADNRIIINGLDNPTIDKMGKIGKVISVQKLIERKYSELETDLHKMLCGMGELTTEYEYSGIYGTTKDSMPIIGEHRDYKNTYFDMPSSINGVLHSVIAAKIITKAYLENGESDNIFSPNRASL